MPIDAPVKLLVHNVLYAAASGRNGPKALAAEAELRDRGDFARADMAFLVRRNRAERMLRNLYSAKILDPTTIAGPRWNSPA